MTDISYLAHQIIGKDDWDAVQQVNDFIYIFDRLPKRMKLAVDYRIQGVSVKEIAVLMKITPKAVHQCLLRAKVRFVKAMF